MVSLCILDLWSWYCDSWSWKVCPYQFLTCIKCQHFENGYSNSVPYKVVQHGMFKHHQPLTWCCDLDIGKFVHVNYPLVFRFFFENGYSNSVPCKVVQHGIFKYHCLLVTCWMMHLWICDSDTNNHSKVLRPIAYFFTHTQQCHIVISFFYIVLMCFYSVYSTLAVEHKR